MASFIKFGSVNVPIIQHFTSNSTIEQGWRPGWQNFTDDEETLFNKGVPVGYGESSQSPHNVNTLHGGVTSLHNDGKLTVQITSTPKQTGDDYTCSTYFGTEQNAQAYPEYTQVIDYCWAEEYSGWSTIKKEYVFVGGSYEYLGETEPSHKVKSYIIIEVQHEASYDPYGSLQYESYTVIGYDHFYIRLAEINAKYNTNYSIEEITTDPNTEDPDYPSEPSDPDPDHTITINPIPIPNLPTMGAATAGFLTMYKLGLAAINQFASDMFANTVWEAIKLFFGNPMNFLVGCMLLPFEPSTGSSYHPKFGIVTFEHAYPAVDNQYKEIDCGYVDIKKFWGSCFDYEPFTKLQIWLPYIGYRDIPTDEFMGEQLHVVYHCDCLTGDCVAFITTTSSLPGGQAGPSVPRVLAQYYGNCGVRVPFSSVNFDAAVAAGINLIGAAASMGLSKGAGAVASHEASKANGGVASISVDEGYSEPSGSGLAGATINMVESMKPTVQKGGAAGASNGYMSIQKPYLIKRIPRQSLPENYISLKGYPSNIGGTLSQFSGYAEVENIQLNNIPAMEGERKEIMKWLAGGVII